MRRLPAPLALLALLPLLACLPLGAAPPPAPTPAAQAPLDEPAPPPPTPAATRQEIDPYPEPAAAPPPTPAPTAELPLLGAPTLTRTIELSEPPAGGDDVRVVQERLAWLGYATPADGRFGPDTAAALRRFQLVNGLFVDGVIEWTTYSRLFSPAAIPAAPFAAVADAETGILIGGSARGNWLDAGQAAALLPEGAALKLYDSAGPRGELSPGSRPPAQAPCGAPRLDLPAAAGLAVLSPWDAQPRPAMPVEGEPEGLAESLAGLLATVGLPQARVRLLEIWAADLHGDGSLEHLYTAADQIPLDASAQVGLAPGSYRVFAIASASGSASYDGAPLLAPAPAEPPGRPAVAGVLDLDGDGGMEVVVRTSFSDGFEYSVYSYSDLLMQRVIELRCRS